MVTLAVNGVPNLIISLEEKHLAKPEAKFVIDFLQNELNKRVCMITGDNKETAEAIARDVGIFDADESAEGKSYTGAEFFSADKDEAWRKHTIMHGGGNRVFSRTEPRDKQERVQIPCFPNMAGARPDPIPSPVGPVDPQTTLASHAHPRPSTSRNWSRSSARPARFPP